MTQEAASVNEEVTVQVSEDSAPTAESPSESAPAPVEVEAVEEAPESAPSVSVAHLNPWQVAEERLGRAVRSVTVHFHATGGYHTLHASPAEGPDTHLELNLGRL